MSLDLTPIAEFMAGTQRSAWLSIGPYQVYVRKAFHLINGNVEITLDLANVQRDGDVYAGFWQIFSELCKTGKAAGIPYLFLENTHNARLHAAYVSRGCIPIPGPDRSLYKIL